MVQTYGTGKVDDARLTAAIREVFDLRPGAFRRYLKLHRPIYRATAAYGHFGREGDDFTWERTDRVDELRAAAGLTAEVGASA
jgi:S-adenosylmethionine synthetase